MKITEFYPEKQGRPFAPPNISLDGRGAGLSPLSVRGIHLAGEYSRTTKTDNYIAGDEMVILVDCSASQVGIILPEAATNSSKVYYIKKIDSSGNSVLIEGDSADETIDGEVSIRLTLQYQYVTVICDSLDWYIIGGLNMKLDELLTHQIDIQEEQTELLKNIEFHLEQGSGEELDKEES